VKDGSKIPSFFFAQKTDFVHIYIMLIINKNTTEPFRVTVTEKVSISNPYFLFVFTNDITKGQVVFLQTNISNHTQRYDEFMLTETSGTINASSGTVEFLPLGSWTYEVFEQASPTNLDPTLTGNRVESGMAKVIGTNETYSRYTGQDITYKVHERNSLPVSTWLLLSGFWNDLGTWVDSATWID